MKLQEAGEDEVGNDNLNALERSDQRPQSTFHGEGEGLGV